MHGRTIAKVARLIVNDGEERLGNRIDLPLGWRPHWQDRDRRGRARHPTSARPELGNDLRHVHSALDGLDSDAGLGKVRDERSRLDRVPIDDEDAAGAERVERVDTRPCRTARAENEAGRARGIERRLNRVHRHSVGVVQQAEQRVTYTDPIDCA